MTVSLYQSLPSFQGSLYATCASVYLVLTALLVLGRGRSRTGAGLIAACVLTSGWAVYVAMRGAGLDNGDPGLDLLSRATWCGFILQLVIQNNPGSQNRIWQLLGWVSLVIISSLGLLPPLISTVSAGAIRFPYFVLVIGPLALAIYGGLLVENLYRNTDAERRWHINALCIGLAAVFLYDVGFYGDSLLYRSSSSILLDGRAIAMTLAAPLVAVAAARNRDWTFGIHVSRAVVFHTSTLVLSGCLLLGLAVTGEFVRSFRSSWGDSVEVGLLTAGVMTIALLLTTGSFRSRLQRLLARHFYSRRYDYQEEWLRSSEILSGTPNDGGLQKRVIRALAAITDSPAGLLWVRDINGSAFQWAGSLNQSAVATSTATNGPFAALFRDGDWIIELDALTERPEFLAEVGNAWLAVPLKHVGGTIGFVVLARPRASQRLDREMFDLLRVVARQAATHVVEQQYAQALIESHYLRDFNKRFAFVIHDMKNVASELAMVLSNATSHHDNPEFQKDAISTVASALTSIRRLLAKIRADVAAAGDGRIIPAEIVAEQVEALRRSRQAHIELQLGDGSPTVAMAKDEFRAVITHLCENAIDACQEGIRVCVHHDENQMAIDIIDSGPGMVAEFVRDELFRPFTTTKGHGLGIGAYQARELIRGAGGELLVFSRPRHGTTMRILLPCTVSQPRSTQRLSA